MNQFVEFGRMLLFVGSWGANQNVILNIHIRETIGVWVGTRARARARPITSVFRRVVRPALFSLSPSVLPGINVA